MTRVMAGISGLIFASLMSAIIGVLLTPTVTGTNFLTTTGFVGIFFLVLLVVALLLGGPLFLLCFYFRIIRWWSACIVGAGIGILVAVGMKMPNQVHIQDLLVTAAVGTFFALCFWIVWRLGN